MEIREITQVKVYELGMNHVRDRWEETRLVAISTDYQKLVDYVNQFRVEGYRLDSDMEMFGQSFFKQFAEGSPLEWFNPPDSLALEDFRDGKGITFQWINLDEFERIKMSDRIPIVCRD